MSEGRRIRPLSVVFVAVVFAILLHGILGERARPEDLGAAFVGAVEEVPSFEELELPVGAHALVGRVLHPDGRGAADVQVLLHRVQALERGAEPLHVVTTDEAGRFRLGELAATDYQAILHVSGYRPALHTITIPHEGEVTWRFERTIEPLEALPEMERATIAGRLVVPEGAPGVHEVVLRPAADTHPLSGAVTLRTRSEPDGAFAFPEAVVVGYDLEVLPLWAAGGSWPVLATTTLASDAEARTDLELPLASSSVGARLVQSGDRPIEGALVQLVPADDPTRLWPPATSDADGRFRIEDLPPGTYRLRVHAGRAVQETEVELAPGQDLELGTLRLAPSS